MKPLNSSSSGIDYQHIPLGITHDLQDMGMSAYEYIRPVFVYQLSRPRIITARIASDMGHEHLHAFAFEETMERVDEAKVVIVAIAGYTDQRLELRNLFRQIHTSPEISRMPDLIDRRKKLLELRVEDAMGIRYESYIHVQTFKCTNLGNCSYICICKSSTSMELFYSRDIAGGICRLDQDESGHCVKVLRHRSGDEISVIDGCGTLYRCRITADSPKGVEAMVLSSEEGWGGHPYRLHLAVCPTKNNDRYEWFAEKACEIGFDELSPIIGEHSERRVLKTARVEKVLISAAKQSLKAAVPEVNEPVSVKEFIAGHNNPDSADKVLKLIAYCFEDERVPRRSIKEVLDGFDGTEIIVMIGPEGDFSKAEAEAALAAGFIPVHLGASRLRTETAALTAASAAYFRYM